MRYKGILIDADETLFDFRTANRRAVGQMLDALGCDHPDGFDRYEAINQACWAALERGELTLDALKTVRWARFFELYGISADPVRTGERFLELLGAQAILLPHAEAVVRAITAKRPVTILTNGITTVQKKRLACSPIADVPTDVVISQEVGFSKPRPEIFWMALKRLGLRREEALMIGDSPTSDVAGANAAGIEVCWLNPRHRPLPAGLHAEYVIDDLRECIPIALME